MKQWIVGATSIALAGCSFVFVHAPDSSAPANVYPECTSSKTWPIIDVVVAGVYAAAAVSAIQREDDPMPAPGSDETKSRLSPRAAAALSLGFAALAGAGGFVGFRRVGACRASRETFRVAYPQGAPTLAPMPGQYPPAQGYPPAPPSGRPQPLPPGWVPTPMPAGYEGGACLANNACAQGLVCASGLCVRPPSAPAGTAP
jgi:hypothetical protein